MRCRLRVGARVRHFAGGSTIVLIVDAFGEFVFDQLCNVFGGALLLQDLRMLAELMGFNRAAPVSCISVAAPALPSQIYQPIDK